MASDHSSITLWGLRIQSTLVPPCGAEEVFPALPLKHGARVSNQKGCRTRTRRNPKRRRSQGSGVRRSIGAPRPSPSTTLGASGARVHGRRDVAPSTYFSALPVSRFWKDAEVLGEAT